MELTAKDRRALIILGAVAGIALLLFLFVLHKGGGSESVSATQNAVGATSGSSSTSGSGESSKPATHNKSHRTQPQPSGRDPFAPLVSDGSGTGGSISTTPTAPAPPPPSPEPSPSPSGSEGTDTIHHAGHVVKLLSVETKHGAQMATISVDGEQFVAKPGQVLVYDFKLIGIDGSCIDIAHVTHPFTLCLPA